MALSRPVSLGEKHWSSRSGHKAQGQSFLSQFCGAAGKKRVHLETDSPAVMPRSQGQEPLLPVFQALTGSRAPNLICLSPFLPPSFLYSSITAVSVLPNKYQDVKGSEWAGKQDGLGGLWFQPWSGKGGIAQIVMPSLPAGVKAGNPSSWTVTIKG